MFYNPFHDYRGHQGELINDLTLYTYPKNFQNALNLIKEALRSERSDELFYNYLVNIAPTDENKEIISKIRDDEIKHYKLFRTIHYQLTGKILSYGEENSFIKPKSYCDGLKRALIGELDAVAQYRQILFGLENRIHINMLIEIMTDELRHSGYYHLLLSTNQCLE